MSLTQLLFSPNGRIPRLTYWLYGITIFVISLILAFVDYFMGTLDAEAGVGCISSIFSLIAFIPGIMVSIKRCHDRDRSGWFLLLAFIPFVNFWVFIELAFLAGTYGTNQYGPDPLSSAGNQAKKKSKQGDDPFNYGPYTDYESEQFGTDTYSNQQADADAAYMASLEETGSGNEILGMSPTEIIILGILLIVICVLGGYAGFTYLNPAATPTPAAAIVQPTATAMPTLAPTATPTVPPMVTSTPIPGWSRFEFADNKAEIWLPSSYQGGDTITYPEIVAMTIDTFLSDEDFKADAKEMIADPNMAFFAFDTQSVEIIRFMSIYYEKVPTDMELTMDAYLDLTMDQLQGEGMQVTEHYLTSLDYYDEVGVIIFENSVPLGEGISINVKLSLHAIRVGDEIWGIFFRTGKDEFETYFPTIENSVRSFSLAP